MKLVFRLLARLPLAVNHVLGGALGRLVYLLSPRYRHRVQDNLRGSGLCAGAADVRRIARANAAEIGKGATELAWALFRPDDVAGKVRERHGWEDVERLRAAGRPIVFVTPHLGAYDVAGRYLWTHVPILAMYRPHKTAWIDELLREGRNRGAAPDGTNVAPATLAGVRMVLKHLRRGGCSVAAARPGAGQGRGRVGRVLRAPRVHDDAGGPAAGGLGRGAASSATRGACPEAKATRCTSRPSRRRCPGTGAPPRAW